MSLNFHIRLFPKQERSFAKRRHLSNKWPPSSNPGFLKTTISIGPYDL